MLEQFEYIPNGWINIDYELPPEDGNYAVTNYPETEMDKSILEYDGYGFKDSLGIYKSVEYWKSYKKLEKIYGKVRKE